MRKPILLILILLSACLKNDKPSISQSPNDQNTIQVPVFIKYTIPMGLQYCDQSNYTPTNYSELIFSVRFDSSAMYQTVDPANQSDINKLFGFADNNADHHQFSARFGWRWSNNALRLFGYTYNNGRLDTKELGIINIGPENNCAIKVTADHYIFSLNGTRDSMTRESITTTAIGYKLFPYFGGGETAPHEIRIWIKELN